MGGWFCFCLVIPYATYFSDAIRALAGDPCPFAGATAGKQDPCPAQNRQMGAILRPAHGPLAIFCQTDRSLAVLYSLHRFLPDRTLQDGKPLVVFPSNASLSDRAHGMAESTMRRHLATLVQAGLISRQDSPNGKSFARQGADGPQAFGFDRRPLLLQAADITRFAAKVSEAASARCLSCACATR